MPANFDLDALVVAATNGDKAAFGDLWRLLAPQVAGYLRGQQVLDADDVTSETFLDCFRNLSKFRSTGPAPGEDFRRFLFTVARRRAIDWKRRKQARPDGPSYDPNLDVRPVGSAEDAALSVLGEQDLLALIDTLTDDQQDVLLLRTVADLSLEQVADVTGHSLGAVKQLQRRGLNALRKKVEAGPYPYADALR